MNKERGARHDGQGSSDGSGIADDSFVVTPASEAGQPEGNLVIGGTVLGPERTRYMLSAHKANPDDPPVAAPLGALPGPDYSNAPGRLALVQGQVYIVGLLVIAQLWLATTALYELLSGHRGGVIWWMAAASLGCFLIALLVWAWPRRRARGR